MAEDYYKSLGVSRSASAEEIAKAYRKLARKFHPDLNPEDAGAKKRFQQIQTAYDTLSDPEKRKMYDQFGDKYEQFGAGGKPFGGAPFEGNPFGGGGSQGFDFGDLFGRGRRNRGGGGGGGQAGFGGVDLEDLLRQFGGSGGGGGGGNRSRRGEPMGGDVAAEITIPLRLAVTGGKTTVQLDRGGRIESIEVKIPQGIRSGKKIRLRGQGEAGLGGKPGDLLLTVHIAADPSFRVDGDNLEMKLPITIGEAIRGASVDVPTPGGSTVTLKIPPRSSGGRRLRVRGQGLPRRDGDPGDLYIELTIKLPDQLSDEAVAAVELIEKGYTKPVRGDL